MNAYATHLAPLVAAVTFTKGSVLELGCGDYSTTILHAICTIQRRKLISTDYNLEWLLKFKDLETPLHTFVHVLDWNSFDPIDEEWDVVFVDHSPGERRVEDIKRLSSKSKYVLVHDSQEAGYKYDPGFQMYKYKYDYKRYDTWTSILSNIQSLDGLKSILQA